MKKQYFLLKKIGERKKKNYKKLKKIISGCILKESLKKKNKEKNFYFR
jgi:hypothetical protein